MMDHPLELADLSLLVRALHKDVSDLDERLRRVEELVRELQEKTPIDLRLASRT